MIRRIAIVAVIAFVAVGCSKPSPTTASAVATAPAAAAATPKVAVVISTLNNPWFVVLGETAKARAEELGYEATIFNSENDTAKEASHFENALAGGYRAILFNATDSDGSIANVRKAKAAGVPVFCIDREINATDAATSQILSDNHGGCVALGQAFVEQLGEKGTYVEILGYLGDNNAHNRSKGFHEVVDNYPDLKMVLRQRLDGDGCLPGAVRCRPRRRESLRLRRGRRGGEADRREEDRGHGNAVSEEDGEAGCRVRRRMDQGQTRLPAEGAGRRGGGHS